MDLSLIHDFTGLFAVSSPGTDNNNSITIPSHGMCRVEGEALRLREVSVTTDDCMLVNARMRFTSTGAAAWESCGADSPFVAEVTLCDNVVLMTNHTASFPSTISGPFRKKEAHTVQWYGLSSSVRVDGKWVGGYLDGIAESDIGVRGGRFSVQSKWSSGVLDAALVNGIASIHRDGMVRVCAGGVTFATDFATFPTTSTPTSSQEFAKALGVYPSLSVVFGMGFALRETARSLVESHNAVSSHVAQSDHIVNAIARAEDALKMSTDRTRVKKAQKTKRDQMILSIAAVLAEAESLNQTLLIWDDKCSSLQNTLQTAGSESHLRTEMESQSSETEAMVSQCVGIKSNISRLTAERSELQKLLAADGARVAEQGQLSRQLADLVCKDSQQASRILSLESCGLQPESHASPLDGLVSRIASLNAELVQLKLRAAQCVRVAGADSTDVAAPSAHNALRTKLAKSGIAKTEQELKELEAAQHQKSELLASLKGMGETSTATFAEEENEQVSTVATLESVLHQLQEKRVSAHEKRLSVEERHRKSLQNFVDRSDRLSSQYVTPSFEHRGTAHSQTSITVNDLHAQLLSKAKLEQTLALLSSHSVGVKSRGAAERPDVPVPDPKQQVSDAKALRASLEDGISNLTIEIRQLGERQRAREQRLISERVKDADDRVAKLQQEVDSRDALINSLRSEAQRVRQLEAKLLSTKSSVGLQKQANIHNAQLAAAVSAAQNKADAALWLTRSAAARIASTKGL